MGRKKIILAAIIGLALVLRLINLNQSFWLDEAAQMIESVRPLARQFDLAADFHPPLYHLIMHFWLKLGTSEIFARLPSVLMGTASVYLFYKIARLLKFNKLALPAALLLCVSPFHIYYSQELRPYMLFAFLSLLSYYYWFKSDWQNYILSSVLMLYSNYFASFSLAGQIITTFLLRKKLFSQNIKSAIFAYIFFIPWLPEFIKQLETGLGGSFSGWTNVVSENAWRAVPLTFAKFIIGKASFDNNLIYSLVLFPVFLVFSLSCYRIYKDSYGRLLLSLFFSSLFFAFAVSLILPVVAPQRLIFLLPIFLLIIVYSARFLPGRIFWLNISLVLATSILGLSLYFTNVRYQRENWRQSVEWLQSNVSGNHIILFSFPEPFAPFIWYNRGNLNAVGIAPDFRVTDRNLPGIVNKISDKKEIYYYSYLSQLTDPGNYVRNTIQNSGFRQTRTLDFPGVGFIYKYEK